MSNAAIESTMLNAEGSVPVEVATGKPWYVYLLLCGDGSFYAGVTTDVAQRLAKHVSGKGAKYTRAKGVVRVLAVMECEGRVRAQQVEWQVKQLPKNRKIAYLGGALTLEKSASYVLSK